MAVDDEIWRPGYDGPEPISGESSFDRATSSGGATGARVGRPWRRILGCVSVGAAVLIAAVVVRPWTPGATPQGSVDVFPAIDVIDGDRLQFASPDDPPIDPLRLLDDPETAFAGADTRRLPAELERQWSVELAPLVADGGANATTWVHAIDRRYVVVGVGDARALSGPAAVHVLDGPTGRKLWVAQVETRIDQVDIVAAIDDALVLTVGSEVVAFDLADGSELWVRRLEKVDGGMEQIIHLDGTDVLALTHPGPEGSTQLIEPVSGVVLGELVGELIGSDFRAHWYVLRGGKLFDFDLGPPGPEIPDDGAAVRELVGTLVATIDSERARAVAVIDGTVVVTLDEMLAVGRLEVDEERAIGAGGMTPLTIDLGTPQWMVLVRGFVPLGGAGFAVVGGGTISGAEILDGRVRFAWQRRGEVIESFATDRGVVLLIGADGRRTQTLVDGATGETIIPLGAPAEPFDPIDVVGNGFVTLGDDADGPRIVGLDLEGNELWTLDGTAELAVGDALIATSTPRADGSFEVAVYGGAG